MRYDLAILGNPSQTSPDLAVDGTAATGVYKLMQRVMILLLTDQEAPDNPGSLGTLIPSLLGGGNVLDPETMGNLFSTAITDIKDSLIANITPDTPADEVLKEIKSYVRVAETAADEVSVEIVVTAQSGDTTTAVIPTSNLTTGT